MPGQKHETREDHAGPDEAFEFVADEPVPAASIDATWQVLIADDEPDVHVATEFALRDLQVEGRPLAFLHAYSAAQARELIARHEDIAVLLLDVVMENETAGLDLVREIRGDLGRRDLRIMLRTGQPGYAPEVDTIRAYDINDYKTKSELTRTRLYAGLTVAIRSFRQIRQLEKIRAGLAKIVHAGVDLSREPGLHEYARGVVAQLCGFLETDPEGLVCASCAGQAQGPLVLAASGNYAAFVGRPLHEIPDPGAIDALTSTLASGTSSVGANTCLFFPVQGTGGIAAYIRVSHPIDAGLQELIEIFSLKITTGFENAILQQDIHRLAYRDDLLDIPNRNSLIEWIQEEQAPGAALALVDIDNFSDMNAALDQDFGNDVLRGVSTRLARHFGREARVARLAADVFGVVGLSVSPASLVAAFAEPFQIRDELLRLSATSGVLQLDGSPMRGIDALRDAGVALKQAKSFARGKAVLFESGYSKMARERMVMLNNLRGAFSLERLFLAYQPVVDLNDGSILGAEALIRWKSDSGHFIPPDRFIPLAEESGLMVHLGQWIIRTALNQLKAITDGGHPGFRMAINVSQVQFQEPDFVADLERALRESGVDPTLVELELTESVAISDIDFIVGTVSRLRPLGVTLAIDDFGTGFSSLSVIRKLAVDRIKIDKSFIRDITEDASIPGLIVALANQLGMQTLAEGVETLEHVQALRALGVREAQGFLFSKAVASEELSGLLARGRMAVPGHVPN